MFKKKQETTRAETITKLFLSYGFIFNYEGLTGNLSLNRKGGSAREDPGTVDIHILARSVEILHIHKPAYEKPRTKVYDDNYSNRLDSYIDALRCAIDKQKVSDSEEARERNEKDAALKEYEEHRF